METLFAYITAPSVEEARRIGNILLTERLAACINILPGMESHYWWQGRIESAQEAVLLVKTRSELREEVLASVRDAHSADVPCIVFLPIAGGNPDYLEWIGEETQ